MSKADISPGLCCHKYSQYSHYLQSVPQYSSSLQFSSSLLAGCHLPDYVKDGTREGHQHLTCPAHIKVKILVSPGRARHALRNNSQYFDHSIYIYLGIDHFLSSLCSTMCPAYLPSLRSCLQISLSNLLFQYLG